MLSLNSSAARNSVTFRIWASRTRLIETNALIHSLHSIFPNSLLFSCCPTLRGLNTKPHDMCMSEHEIDFLFASHRVEWWNFNCLRSGLNQNRKSLFYEMVSWCFHSVIEYGMELEYIRQPIQFCLWFEKNTKLFFRRNDTWVE